MEQALLIARYVGALGFFVLGVLALKDWLQHRGADRAYLAGALGLLGLVSVVGRVHELLGYRYRWISDISVPCFLASGYFLLLFRHTFLPVPKRVLSFTFAVVSATSIFTIALQLPSGPNPQLTSAEYAVVVAFFIVWGACVGEPAYRFWRASRGRPRVQRARLRALALGYGGILAILTFALSAGGSGLSTPVQFLTQIFVIALIPILHASFAPPAWLRAIWRSGHEQLLRSAVDDLVVFSSNVRGLCVKALESALKVVGSDVGFLQLPGAGIVAAAGITEADASALLELLPPDGEPRIGPLADGSNNSAIVIPLRTAAGTGALTVISSSFTPLFGSDEVETLSQYVWSIGLALERIALVERLTESEHRLVEAQHVARLGSFEWHPDTGALAWSDEHFRIWGIEPRDVGYQDFIDGVYPEDRARVQAATDHTLGSGDDFDQEYRVLRPDGEVRTVHARSYLRVDSETHKEIMLGSVQDITERKQAEHVLEGQRQLHESLLTAEGDLGEGIVIVDTAAHRFTWVNSAAAEIYGYTPDEMLALEDARVLIPPEELDRFMELKARWEEDGTLPKRQESLALRNDGTRIHIESASKALDRTRVISVFRDVTDRKNAELALQDAYERERAAAESLRELDQMKNTFLSAVSHDLRTPLTAVLGFARTLEEKGSRLSPAETKELVGRICSGAERLHHMLMDLLDLDRLRRGILEAKRIPTRIDQLVKQSVDSLDLPWHEIDLDCDEFTFPVDPGQVERIVENLVINAARHTPPKTRVCVRVRNLVTAVSIEVQDDGPGVADHLKERIFEPFRQGDGPQVSGTGLGLSLVTQFAELHGGRAWVEDGPRGGAIFKVELPEATDEASPQRPKRAMGGAGRLRLPQPEPGLLREP